jgi:hypothetical protein
MFTAETRLVISAILVGIQVAWLILILVTRSR